MGYLHIFRFVEYLIGCSHLPDLTLHDDGDFVCKVGGFSEVMRNMYGGQPIVPVYLLEPFHDTVLEGGVDGTERFIEKEYLRFGVECSGKRDTLLLSAAEFADLPLQKRTYVQKIGNVPEVLLYILYFPVFSRKAYVLFYIKIGEEGEILVDEADLACFGCSVGE